MHTVLQIVRDGQPPEQIKSEPLPDGEAGTLRTLGIMAQMSRADSQREPVKRWLLDRVLFPRRVRAHDDEGEVNACFEYCRDSLRWTRDARGVERVADTLSTLNLRWGDCVDKSIVLASFLAALGHTPYFVVMAQLPRNWQGWTFNHVYVGLMQAGKHVAYDPTPEDFPPGREAEALRRMGFRIFEDVEVGADGRERPKKAMWLLPN